MTTPAAPQTAANVGSPVELTIGTPEYDAAMVEAGNRVNIQSISTDGSQVSSINAPEVAPPDTPSEPPSDRPAWLPEKFKSAEDMAKAYSELEQKQSKPTDTPKAIDVNNIEVDPAGNPVVPGVDTGAIAGEFAANGFISPESYEKLASAGIDKATVDNYISGQQARADARTQEGFATVGGEDNFKAMAGWAKANLSGAQLDAFNQQVNNPNKEVALLAVRGLNAQYVAAVGKAPSGLITGSSSAAIASTTGFQSRNQIVQAMSDPRYDSDPAYRNSVADRLRVTDNSVI